MVLPSSSLGQPSWLSPKARLLLGFSAFLLSTALVLAIAAAPSLALTIDGCEIGPGAECPGVNFREANLSGVNLRGANLSKANLAEANLSGADLTEADLSQASGASCYRTADVLLCGQEGIDLSSRLAV